MYIYRKIGTWCHFEKCDDTCKDKYIHKDKYKVLQWPNIFAFSIQKISSPKFRHWDLYCLFDLVLKKCSFPGKEHLRAEGLRKVWAATGQSDSCLHRYWHQRHPKGEWLKKILKIKDIPKVKLKENKKNLLMHWLTSVIKLDWNVEGRC